MSFENYRLAQEAGFQRMEALWLIACLIKGVPMPDWMIEKLEGEPDV